MIYRDRQAVPPPSDPTGASNHRDHYLDNCFLLCLNRDDQRDLPEIHRLENHLLQDLCQTNPINKSLSKQQQQSRRVLPDARQPISDQYEFDEYHDEQPSLSPRQENNRRMENQTDYYPESQTPKNRSKYPTGDTYYSRDRPSRYPRRDDYNIMQHSDDELSVYEVYVPTNTLNRLSDKRIDNNMVLIDYEDLSMMHQSREGPPSPYRPPSQYPRNIPSQYNHYPPINPYGVQMPYDMSTGYSNGREIPSSPQGNHPMQQAQFNGYYQNEADPYAYPSQSGSFPPSNFPIDRSNAVNIRRHLYSPSQLPQGLTEGQLVMLLQKGSQYQQPIAPQPAPTAQLFPPQKDLQPASSSAVTVSQQPSPAPSAVIEPSVKSPEYIPIAPMKVPAAPPQIFDHRLVDEERTTKTEDASKPMTNLNIGKPVKDVESKESGEKKKDKSSDAKKDKKAEKDSGSNKKDSKKDGKKDKSNGKDAKKKKK